MSYRPVRSNPDPRAMFNREGKPQLFRTITYTNDGCESSTCQCEKNYSNARPVSGYSCKCT
jgi:hypothetical protein